MLERDIEGRCKRFARERGWYVRKFVSPSNRSVPDDIFVKNGRVLFVEFKKPGGKLTDKQRDEAVALELAGAEFYLVDFYDQRWAGILGEAPAPRMPIYPS
jgi:hypothetical protein